MFVIVAASVLPVLAAILFPPMPPRPAAAQQISHTSPAYGVDEWHYTTATDVCAVIDDYEARGAACTRQPGHCDDAPRRAPLAATCTGGQPFSRFAMRWQADLYNRVSHTEIALSREIAWTR